MEGSSAACVQLLVQRGALVNARTTAGVTPLHLAAAGTNGFARRDCLLVLLRAKAQLDMGDKEGWTPMHRAACYGQEAAISCLASAGARLDVKSLAGHTPLEVALQLGQGRRSTARLLAELMEAQGSQTGAAALAADKHSAAQQAQGVAAAATAAALPPQPAGAAVQAPRQTQPAEEPLAAAALSRSSAAAPVAASPSPVEEDLSYAPSAPAATASLLRDATPVSSTGTQRSSPAQLSLRSRRVLRGRGLPLRGRGLPGPECMLHVRSCHQPPDTRLRMSASLLPTTAWPVTPCCCMRRHCWPASRHGAAAAWRQRRYGPGRCNGGSWSWSAH